MNLSAEISVGEFLDKITILEIKSERIKDTAKLDNIRKELSTLRRSWDASPFSQQDISAEVAELKQINEKLWEIEDYIRDKEAEGAFDARFIELARSVYFTNDERAAVKRKINLKVGSELVEEKSYADYRRPDA
ncbi:hypothetical protein Tel_02935 [Candidatus Tenderia electrophaga]|jgi:predicted RNA-binding protein with EMAP domain|uniref:Uncharacterized protein n=1 Tax=Candidatus Tenderia electrophaga TaxID=1748243 RepID=A0A0S2TAK7_9GAMM|nr:hypothetical protein Tel_02935 [Candidatus Tenderia electrophaga]